MAKTNTQKQKEHRERLKAKERQGKEEIQKRYAETFTSPV